MSKLEACSQGQDQAQAQAVESRTVLFVCTADEWATAMRNLHDAAAANDHEGLIAAAREIQRVRSATDPGVAGAIEAERVRLRVAAAIEAEQARLRDLGDSFCKWCGAPLPIGIDYCNPEHELADLGILQAVQVQRTAEEMEGYAWLAEAVEQALVER